MIFHNWLKIAKDYCDSAIAAAVTAVGSIVVLKGSWDASAGTFPGTANRKAGWSYIVSVAGTVDGVSFSVNDRLIAIADNASTTVFAGNWFKADYTDQVLSVNGETGSVTGFMKYAVAGSVTALQTFDSLMLAIKGSGTGKTKLTSANTGATDYTATLPAKTGTVAMLDDIGVWQSYTPTVTSSVGAITSYVIHIAEVAKIGTNTTAIMLDITITDNGTGAGGVLITLPVSALGSFTLCGREVAITGKMLHAISVSATLISTFTYDNLYPAATGAHLMLSGIYKSA